jgi:hydroxymethylbilane synthase
MARIRIGTRGSELARVQADQVAATLRAAGYAVEIVEVRTAGDRAPEARFTDLGPDIFTRALDDALRAGTIDCAVHSAKDVPTEIPAAVTIAACIARHYPEDALVSFGEARTIAALPQGARVGTSSLRRQALLLSRRPDLSIEPLRGNVRTRLRRAEESGFAALVLARAGLARLGLEGRVSEILNPDEFVPQAGQGALAVSALAAGSVASELRELLDDGATRNALTAERAFLRQLGGGCQVPAGAHAVSAGGVVRLRAVLLSADGRTCLRARREAPDREAESAGRAAAEEVLAAGGGAIIRDLRRAGSSIDDGP